MAPTGQVKENVNPKKHFIPKFISSIYCEFAKFTRKVTNHKAKLISPQHSQMNSSQSFDSTKMSTENNTDSPQEIISQLVENVYLRPSSSQTNQSNSSNSRLINNNIVPLNFESNRNSSQNVTLHHFTSGQNIFKQNFSSPISYQRPTFEITRKLMSYRKINLDILKSVPNANDAQIDRIVEQLSLSTSARENIEKIKFVLEKSLPRNRRFEKNRLFHEIGLIGTGLGMYDSDLHLVLQLSGVLTEPEMSDALKSINSCFRRTLNPQIKYNLIRFKSNRGQTSMPVLQLILSNQNEPIGNLTKYRKVVISINQMAGLSQSALLQFYAKYDSRFPKLNTIFLYWAKENDFTESESLSFLYSMSRYALTLLVVEFLRVLGILPSLEQIQSAASKLGHPLIKYDSIKDDNGELIQFVDYDKLDVDKVKMHILKSLNTQSIPELVCGLIKRYGLEFRYDQQVACPGIEQKRFTPEQLLQNRMDKFPKTFRNFCRASFSIEDPLMNKYNLGYGPAFAREFRLKLRSFYYDFLKEKGRGRFDQNPYSECRNPEKKCFETQSQPYFNIYTDASTRSIDRSKQKVGGAFVVLLNEEIYHSEKFRLHNCTNLQAEMLSILKAVMWCTKTDKSCVILSDSENSLHKILDPSNRDNLAVQIRMLIVMHPKHICLKWIKAHVGVRGNEIADIMAKDATYLDCVSYYFSKIEKSFVEAPILRPRPTSHALSIPPTNINVITP